MKGKILCPAGCQNPVARITKAKEILKNPRPAGSWRPLKCIFSGKGKSRSQRAAKPRSGVILTEEKDSTQRAGSPALFALYTEKPGQGQSAAVTEQDSTAVPKFAFRSFCPCGNLVGECLPQTLLIRLAPLKNPSKYFFEFFKNSSALHPVFLLLVRGHHAQPKGGFYHAKTI